MKNQQFPDDFLWGAATSSHQIEGGTTNDWTEWEKGEGHIKTGEVSGKAANSWQLYEKDFDLLEQMNLRAYRFSIEWSRIEPEPGKYDQEAIAVYRRMLESLARRGIEPIVTLHHFTNPLWLDDWSSKKTIDAYLKYVELVVESLGEQIRYYITINEPNVYVTMGYMQGAWPPGRKNPVKEYRALRNMHRAHKKAFNLIKEVYKKRGWSEPLISMAFNLQNFIATNDSFVTKNTAKWSEYFANHYTINKVVSHLDFIGINYYFTNWVKGLTWHGEPEDVVRNQLGWSVYPDGLHSVVMAVSNYGLPIMITENGQPDSQDKLRPWYIVESLKSLHQSINDGAKVFGYMHWSLMDNWEWWDGYSGRFGLAEVNFNNFERKIRDSGYLYAEISKSNKLPDIIPEIKQ